MIELKSTAASLATLDTDALVVGLYASEALHGAAAEIDRASGGVLSRLIEHKELTGKAHEVIPCFALPGVTTPLVLVTGLGERSLCDRGVAFRAASAAALWLAAKSRPRVAYGLDDAWPADVGEAAIAGSLVGCHGQDLYRAEKKRTPPASIAWSRASADVLKQARALADGVNLTRRLVNEPPQEVYPESFAARAENVAAESGLEIEVWDQARLERERCGSLLAVAKGSTRPPRLVIVRHRGGNSADVQLALVGKGVTFDSGGLSLKPTDSMLTMKCDMAGAATVLGTMQTIAQLQLPLHVVGLMGLVENMPSGSAMKLGDVLRARSGKTIEVLNTDAEGRLVLADVLSVAVDLGAPRIVDLATLTGACVVALGMDVVGAMTNDQSWCDRLLAAAGDCGEPAWQLPMFAEYGEQIRGDVADIRNTGQGRWGGAITAAKFLEEFVEGRPWVHLDIAGPAFLEKPKPWLDAGASGVMVRTLVELVRGMV